MAGVRDIPCEKKLKEMRRSYLVQLVFDRAQLTALQPGMQQFFQAAPAALPAAAALPTAVASHAATLPAATAASPAVVAAFPATAASPAAPAASASPAASETSEDPTELARQAAEAFEEAEAHRMAADAALRLQASSGLEDNGAIELALGEPTETTAQQEYDESAAYAHELSDERNYPFVCGLFGCNKRYQTREELQKSANGKELGCGGGPFGWCIVAPCEGARQRRKRSRLGEDG